LLQTEALPALVKRAANGGSGQLSLSFISTADYSILPPLLTQFRQHYPQVHIALREATTDIQLDDLLERKIDGGLLLPPLTEKTKHLLDYMPLLTEPLIAAVPSGFWKKKQAIPLQTLVRLPLVIFPRHISPSFHDTILSCFHEAGLTPIIAQEAIQMQTIVGLVSAGMGMALVPQSVSNLKRPGVDYLPLASIAPSIETGIAWRRDNHSPVLRAFLTLAAQSTSTGMTLA
jgi:DNA-binding transcriptional LysR family regulator